MLTWIGRPVVFVYSTPMFRLAVTSVYAFWPNPTQKLPMASSNWVRSVWSGVIPAAAMTARSSSVIM
jgi:hypothetical protein